MNNKRSCNPHNLAAIEFLAGLAVAAFLAVAPVVHASVPDWIKTVAHDQLPAYSKETVAVVLYDEQITTVKDSGEIETLYRTAVKILRPEGRKYGKVVVNFDKETRLTYLKAWCIPADGKEYEVKEKDAFEVSAGYGDLYGDKEIKVLQIPAAEPGNVIGYEYIQRRRPFVLQDNWWFQDTVPVRRARFTLQLPAGWEYDTQWVNSSSREPQSSNANQFAWEIDDLPPVTVEPDMPPFRAVAGRLAVNYYPRPSSEAAKEHNSWRKLGAWYQQLAGPSRTSSPEIKQKVAELTANIPGLLGKMRALASFMQRDIRYVAIEIGIGGFQPHPADATFTYRYGDCKDKAALLSTMLRELGVESYFVLIHTNRGIVLPDFPSALTFNHAILAIRLPDSIQSDSLYAVVNDPKLGRLLFFDPTSRYVPLGYLPNYLQENYGLVATPDSGELVRLPVLPPETNRLMRTASLMLTPTGALGGTVQEVRTGGEAAVERAQFLEVAASDRKKLVEDFLGNFLTAFTVADSTVTNLDKYDDNLTLQYTFQTEGYAKMAGNLLIVRPRVLGAKGRDLLEGRERKYPVEFEEATVQTDAIDITLPPGYVVDDLPQPVNVSKDFGEYHSLIELKGNVLHYSRTFEIKSLIVPTKELGDLKQFYRQIATDERASAVLRRTN